MTTTMTPPRSRPTMPQARGEFEAALGARFREVRKRQKVWLVPLAKALGCSVNTIRWHEYGARMLRADLLVRAAEFMNVPHEDLIGTKVGDRLKVYQPMPQANDEGEKRHEANP